MNPWFNWISLVWAGIGGGLGYAVRLIIDHYKDRALEVHKKNLTVEAHVEISQYDRRTKAVEEFEVIKDIPVRISDELEMMQNAPTMEEAMGSRHCIVDSSDLVIFRSKNKKLFDEDVDALLNQIIAQMDDATFHRHAYVFSRFNGGADKQKHMDTALSRIGDLVNDMEATIEKLDAKMGRVLRGRS